MASKLELFIVDDSEETTKYLTDVLSGFDLPISTFSSIKEFIRHTAHRAVGCLILNEEFRRANGTDALELVRRDRPYISTIVVLSSNNADAAIHAMKSGAVDCFKTPLVDSAVIEGVQRALDFARRAEQAVQADAGSVDSAAKLAPREKEVLELLMLGASNKEVARKLGISHRTVETYRNRLMAKTGAQNFVELIRMTLLHGLLE